VSWLEGHLLPVVLGAERGRRVPEPRFLLLPPSYFPHGRAGAKARLYQPLPRSCFGQPSVPPAQQKGELSFLYWEVIFLEVVLVWSADGVTDLNSTYVFCH